MTTPTTAEDVIREIAASGARRVKVAITDLDGVMRGKYIQIEKLRSALEGGFGVVVVEHKFALRAVLANEGDGAGEFDAFDLDDVEKRLFLQQANQRLVKRLAVQPVGHVGQPGGEQLVQPGGGGARRHGHGDDLLAKGVEGSRNGRLSRLQKAQQRYLMPFSHPAHNVVIPQAGSLVWRVG